MDERKKFYVLVVPESFRNNSIIDYLLVVKGLIPEAHGARTVNT